MTRKLNGTRTLAAVLVIALAVIITGTILSGKAVRADAVTGTGWSYEDGVLTISDDDAFELANTRWQQYSGSITEIVLDSSVTVIPEGAFASCSKLQTINLSHVTSIGDSAFNELKNLKNIDLSSVVEIGNHAFTNCKSLESISLPNVKTIGPMAFYYCQGLESVVLGESIETIDASAFGECTALETINLSNVKTIDEGAFIKCEALETADLSSATFIGQGVFQRCSSLNSVVLGRNLTEISSKAFLDCISLKDVDLSYVETVGEYAFSGCNSLSDVTLGENLTTLGNYAFERCNSLRSVDLSYVTSLGQYCFYGCYNSDGGYGLEEVILGNGITSIPDYAFSGCQMLSEINLKNVVSIGQQAFYDCASLSYVDLSSVTSIGYYGFGYCRSLYGIDLSSVQSVGNDAFYYCDALTEADLRSATVIEDYAFCECKAITSVTFSNQLQGYGEYVFEESPLESILFIGSESQFYDIFGWYVFDSDIVTFSACDVEFYLDSEYPIENQVVTKGEKAVAPEDPAMDDQVFVGWYLDRSGKEVFDFDTPITEDLKLYACWMKSDDEENVFKGHTLSLGGAIGVDFYTVLPDNLSDDAYMKFTVEDLNQEKTVAVSEAKTVTVDGVTYTIFSYGVPAKNMTSVISAELIDHDDTIASNSYTVQQYAAYILDHAGNYDETTIQLVTDMVNFGSAAQEYFNYNVENPANGFWLEEERFQYDGRRFMNMTSNYSYNPEYDELPEGLAFDSASLSLKSDTIMKLYFTDSEDRNITYICNGVELEKKTVGGSTVIQINDIPAHNILDTFKIEIRVEGDETEYSVQYSPANYSCTVITFDLEEETVPGVTEKLQKLMRFYYLYGQSAKNYIGDWDY